jgi:hypothetical protein
VIAEASAVQWLDRERPIQYGYELLAVVLTSSNGRPPDFASVGPFVFLGIKLVPALPGSFLHPWQAIAGADGK